MNSEYQHKHENTYENTDNVDIIQNGNRGLRSEVGK